MHNLLIVPNLAVVLFVQGGTVVLSLKSLVCKRKGHLRLAHLSLPGLVWLYVWVIFLERR